MGRYAVMLVIVMAIALSNCTHVMRRDGYKTEGRGSRTDCAVTFVRYMTVEPAKHEVLGTVKLRDSGFSFASYQSIRPAASSAART